MKWAFLPVLAYNGLLIYYSLISPLILATQPVIGPALVLAFSFSEGFYIHVAAYFILAVLWGLSGFRRLGCLLVSSTTGGLLEIVQPLFHRYASLGDITANIVGALAGFAILAVVFDRRFFRWPKLRNGSYGSGKILLLLNSG